MEAIMATRDVVSKTLSAAVGAGGTFTTSYPANKSRGDYVGGTDHMIMSNGIRTLFSKSGDFSLSFGATTITVTLNTALALADNTVLYLHLDRAAVGAGELPDPPLSDKVTEISLVRITLGAPVVNDANGYVESQNLTAAGVFSVDTTVAAALAAAALDGVADVPRNVVAAWTGAAVITITGTDEYGEVLVESSASGTSLAGKKAFKTVTDISVSADVTGLTVGTGNVLGLPLYLQNIAAIDKEFEDDAAATAGTPLAGVLTAATATTGDVRGTYVPNSTPNGSKRFEIEARVRSLSYRGVAQYAG
jgi:hypothetical protein